MDVNAENWQINRALEASFLSQSLRGPGTTIATQVPATHCLPFSMNRKSVLDAGNLSTEMLP